MRESLIMKNIQIALANIGFRLLRNNVGVLQDSRGQYVTYGVGNPGGSDLIGWKTVEIMPWHTGTKVAIFVACEVKRPGQKPTKEQKNFIEAVNTAGGIGFVATSVDEALNAIQRPR